MLVFGRPRLYRPGAFSISGCEFRADRTRSGVIDLIRQQQSGPLRDRPDKRRLLRDIAAGTDSDQDTTALEDFSVMARLRESDDG